MFNGNYELNSEAFKVVEEIGRNMPGGFFIYKAAPPEELLYANQEVYNIFGCRDLEEFKTLTGFNFRGMVHPEDYAEILNSIENQIERNDDNFDHVEYRIIRKDGAVRWVDDYGHFSQTKTHGGVYYVFISDITEKKAQLDAQIQRTEEENKRLIEQIESAAKLADLLGSVSSLLTNMPAMSFSKDAETGKYLACNQSFAEYAHKKHPREVVGLTDFEIFDKKTAEKFVADDKMALSMDKPYIFFEDVPDAGGKILRNLQTTKMKFTDTNGKICCLGMCVDVTEMTRIKSAEAEARIKQQELEEKIALQEKLLEQSETLKEALKDAEEASRAKTQFLSNMSHEIRTPITAILGMNELIRRESTDENIIKYSNNIDKAGTSLLGIINDILDFSKIEAGRMELVSAKYSIRELITDLVNLIRFRLEDKGLILKLNIDSRLPTVLFGDELRLKQIITNLLTNAAKYTEKGTVELSFQVTKKIDDMVYISVAVKDTGIGIRPEEMDKLFSAFDRLDVIRTRGIEGTGLGLAISARMLDLMNSKLKVVSEYERGSEFSFVVGQKIIDAGEIGNFDPLTNSGTEKREGESHLSFTAPNARVLIVDDTELNLQVVVGLLKRTQIKIDTAKSGRECLELFGADDYDMIFLDYRMPGMDGIETLKKLYELYPEKAHKTPMICLTASAVSGDREKMLSAGFDDYLSKPVNIAKMEGMMIKYLPEEKVTLAEPAPTPKSENLSGLPEGIFKLKEIDPDTGVDYCGGVEDYMDAVAVFSMSIAQKSADIEKACHEKDLRTFINLVHSLKSTSRLIGATGISDIAFTLEQAGKNDDIEYMEKVTPELLTRYRKLQVPLEEIVDEWDENH